jgi:hypothetical protein
MLHKIDSAESSSTVSLSDEATFHLNCIVNRYNCRIWRSQPPQVIIEHRGARPKVNVWCGMITDAINGPYFLSGSNRERPFAPGHVGRLHIATIALRCIVPAEWSAPLFGNIVH